GEVDLALGQSITLTVTAVVQVTAEFGETITNDATLQWTSLNGTDGNERGGSGGSLNDYNDSDSDSFTIKQASIEKIVIDTDAPHTDLTEATIGEVITYHVIVTLPEGSIGSFTVEDLLPLAGSGVALEL